MRRRIGAASPRSAAETAPGDAAIVRAVIVLAHSLGLQVVAEGVERHAQLDYLKELGCDIVQGYVVSAPVAAGDITEYPGKVRLISVGFGSADSPVPVVQNTRAARIASRSSSSVAIVMSGAMGSR